jgi:hypothetical protein
MPSAKQPAPDFQDLNSNRTVWFLSIYGQIGRQAAPEGLQIGDRHQFLQCCRHGRLYLHLIFFKFLIRHLLSAEWLINRTIETNGP